MPELNFVLDTQGRKALYEREAMMYEKLADEAYDENSKRAFKNKANELWQMAVELRGA